MSKAITLGFQSNSGSSPVTFFNINVHPDGKKHQLTDLIGHATNDGNPIEVPADFFVNEVLLSKPVQLTLGGTVEIESPSGVSTLDANTTNTKVTSALKGVTVKASK